MLLLQRVRPLQGVANGNFRSGRHGSPPTEGSKEHVGTDQWPIL